MDLSALRVEEV
nr:truncated breast and ovarian cancer susceptibility protein 1 [Homo sapiens]